MTNEQLQVKAWNKMNIKRGKYVPCRETWKHEPEPTSQVKAQRYADWLIDTGRTVAWVYPATPKVARDLLENSGLEVREYDQRI
jgi:hypothetical protein